MKRISPEEIIHLNEKWEDEYEDVEMTDEEWELKRGELILQAQLDSCEKELREIFERVNNYTESDNPKWLQALKQQYLGGD